MPSKYKKKKIAQYTEEDLANAIREVTQNGSSMYAAAKKYQIPTTTLYDKIKGNYNTNVVGRPVAIPLELESQLANAIRILEKWGFGLSREEVMNVVADFVKCNKMVTPFKNNKPGKDWFINFRKRHNLSIKKPQPVEYVRKQMTDPFVIFEYFKLLEVTLTDLNLFESPDLIWNLDETSLSLDPTRTKVVGAINKPCSRTTCGTGKENITVLAAVNASGKKATPLIVFKGKNVWDQWMATTGNYGFELAYAASSKGWMETDIFHNYLQNVLIPSFGDDRPVLIIYDGHSTHVDVRVIELAIKNNITILKLPPHTSHLLQPLDISVFKSFKNKWDSKLVDWQRHNVGVKMPKNIFSQTFADTWNETDPEVIKSGFKKAGIVPFDAQVIPKDKYDPAAYRRYEDQKISFNLQAHVSLKTPKSLKGLCVDFFNMKCQLAETLDVVDQGTTTKNVMFLSAVSKNDEETQSFVTNQTSTLPKCLRLPCDNIQRQEKKTPKINIISNIKVDFEEILLAKIRQDKRENTTAKKKRVAKGAEVITAATLIAKKNEEESKKQNTTEDLSQTQNSKGKRKINSKDEKPGPSGVKTIKKKKNQQKETKAERFEHAEEVNLHEQSPCKQANMCIKLDEETILRNEALNTPKTKGKGKGKGKKTRTGKENIYLAEENKTSIDNMKTEEKTVMVINKKVSDTVSEDTEGKSGEMQELILNDAVLVRYFSRKKWKYYIGFIINIYEKDNDTYFTIDFLRTINRPHLTFVQPKRKDRDEITKELIVKKVDLRRSFENDSEFILTNEDDKLYFE
ncbi:hypothetical protein ABMA28_017415 [Loxostege sticticalis]|uniref:Transposase n=1 Tax=Loxostege sticticalis TaxID=481309 RepID=A0ABD0S282_LOXSC